MTILKVEKHVLVRLLNRCFAILVCLIASPVWAAGALTDDNVFAFNNSGEPETLDPGKATGVPERNILLALFEGLTILNPTASDFVPGVAKSWKIQDNGKRYTFELRKTARWSNGLPVTAHDFVFAWQRLLSPKMGAPFARHLFAVERASEYNSGQEKDFTKVGIRAASDYTLEIRLKHPVPYFLHLTSFYPFSPVPKRVVERWGDLWVTRKHLVTNGSFRLSSWVKGKQMILKKNPQYWDANSVRVDELRIYPVGDRDKVLQLYEQDKIDWTGHSGLPTAKVPMLAGRHDFFTSTQLATYFLRLNVRRPPFDRPAVRQALYLAIDRNELVQTVATSGEEPARRITPAGIKGYMAPQAPTFNPKQATAKLSEAGYCVGGMRPPACRPFPAFSLIYNRDQYHQRVMSAVVAMWRRHLGLDRVRLVELSWGDYLKRLRDGKYTVSRSGWVADYPDPIAFLEVFEGNSATNYMGWEHEGYDRLIAAARLEADPDKRVQHLANAETILLKEQPVIPLFFYSAPYLLKPTIGGLVSNPLDLHPYKWIYFRPVLTTKKGR